MTAADELRDVIPAQRSGPPDDVRTVPLPRIPAQRTAGPRIPIPAQRQAAERVVRPNPELVRQLAAVPRRRGGAGGVLVAALVGAGLVAVVLILISILGDLLH